MAGFSSNKPSAPITGINVTPLVDITLVLLIIFMVTAKLVVSRAVPMDLPKAATGGEVQQIFSVLVLPDHSLQVGGEKLDDAQLLARAKTALAQSPELRAIIDADGNVPHHRVMATLDVLRQAGLGRVAFGVSPKPPLPGAEEAKPAPAPAEIRAAP
ncbi:MAG TPA: biopolymer transporter ExbD [Polyangiales bacterium]